MWLNPNSVTLGSTCVNHVQCHGMNPKDQIHNLLHPWILQQILADFMQVLA